MKILVINCGSSSVKYRLYEGCENLKLLAKGAADRIGLDDSVLSHTADGRTIQMKINIPDHRTALENICNTLTDKKLGPLDQLDRVDAIGHRIVHGGPNLTQPVVVDSEVFRQIESASCLAPLHSRPNLTGIETIEKLIPKKLNIAVFDTSAHSKMPSKSYLYGIPLDYYREKNFRRYGFHGISHLYVAEKAAEMMHKPFGKSKIITCHLGNGSSITAFDSGRSIDTSMGLTPLPGPMMGTRSGDIDPEIIIQLIKQYHYSIEQVKELLNKKSGFLGITGKRDMRDIIEDYNNDSQNAQLAVNMFCYQVKKYIGSYIAALNGLDCLVFTAGIGENAPLIRKLICKDMDYLGLKLDLDKNRQNLQDLTSADSKASIYAIPTDEELSIAQTTAGFVLHLETLKSIPGH